MNMSKMIVVEINISNNNFSRFIPGDFGMFMPNLSIFNFTKVRHEHPNSRGYVQIAVLHRIELQFPH